MQTTGFSSRESRKKNLSFMGACPTEGKARKGPEAAEQFVPKKASFTGDWWGRMGGQISGNPLGGVRHHQGKASVK